MISREKYVTSSLELHLFFMRVMKEHAIFLEAGLGPKNSKIAKELDKCKGNLEKLLFDVVKLSKGRVRQSIVDSGEVFTDYTLETEKKTEHYTGININSKITTMEKDLMCAPKKGIDSKVASCVKDINNKAIKLIDELIDLKMKILDDVLCCKIFTSNYPSLVEHTIEEAKLYRSYIDDIECNRDIDEVNISKIEAFWNEIMMEHSLFIRGLLDPSEYELINTAHEFAFEFNELIQQLNNVTNVTIDNVTHETLKETTRLRDFKEEGTKGIMNCNIKSLILPLLSDHVLREANHYIRILRCYEK